jgi:hypothetical protein
MTSARGDTAMDTLDWYQLPAAQVRLDTVSARLASISVPPRAVIASGTKPSPAK